MGNNFRMDHREIVGRGVDWMHLAQDSCGHGNELSDYIKAVNFLTN
jgi:hypothetical protein